MISSRELRIGNWVSEIIDFAEPQKEGVPSLVSAVSEYGATVKGKGCLYDEHDCDEDSITGITITDSILRKIKGVLIANGDIKAYIVGKCNIYEYSTGGYKLHFCSLCFDVNYVHELQNLYFSLLKEEIEIKF